MTELTRETLPETGPEPLDPAVLQAIRSSASRMAGAEEAFIRLLHEEIETLVRPLPDEGWPMCERTARAILWLALSDPPADAVAYSLRWLREANQADGFPESEYVSIGHALVRIAREMAGTEVDHDDWLGLDPVLHVVAAAPPDGRAQARRSPAGPSPGRGPPGGRAPRARPAGNRSPADPRARPPGNRPPADPRASPPGNRPPADRRPQL